MESNSYLELEVLFENMAEGFVVQDENDKIIKYNLQACEILGLTPKQMEGKSSYDPQWRAIAEDGTPFKGEEHPSIVCRKSGKPQYNKVMGVHRPDGTLRWIQINSSPLFKKNDETKNWQTLTTFNDITESLELKKQVEKDQHRMKMAMNALNFGLWDWDISNNILIWDDQMYDIFGVEKEKFNGAYEAFESTLHPLEKERLAKSIDKTVANKDHIFREEFNIIKNGEQKCIVATAQVIYEKNVIRMIGVNYDITEKNKTDALIQQTSKLSSLGEMAAGVAHEINNPLSIISGRASQIKSFIERKNYDQDKLLGFIDSIQKTTERIAAIIRGLKNFARDGSNDELIDCKLSQIISDTLSFCESRFFHNEVSLTISEYDPSIVLKCKETEISQILLNLLNNAFDAVQVLPKKWVKIEIETKDNKLNISIIDSGNGIPEDYQHKIFDPFFTTKGVGKGTGLGVSISKGLAEKNGGNLSLDPSSPHTCFVLSFPLSKE